MSGAFAVVRDKVAGTVGSRRLQRVPLSFYDLKPMPEHLLGRDYEVFAMLFASGFWDGLILSIRVSADGWWDVHVGAVIVLLIFIFGARGLDWFDEEPKADPTGGPNTPGTGRSRSRSIRCFRPRWKVGQGTNWGEVVPDDRYQTRSARCLKLSLAAVPPSFPLGAVVATPGALDALAEHPRFVHQIIGRHASGEWGEVDAEDWKANDRAVVNGARLLSAYTTPTGTRVWVLTEADRSATTVLLPSEY